MSDASRDVASAAIKMAITKDRTEEKNVSSYYTDQDILTVAVDFGGEFMTAVPKIIERAVVAAKKVGLIDDSHMEEGAVAGAAHEAVSQIYDKAIGLNLGGKIGIARSENHIAVAVFFAVGLLNLNDVAMGLGHRAI